MKKMHFSRTLEIIHNHFLVPRLENWNQISHLPHFSKTTTAIRDKMGFAYSFNRRNVTIWSTGFTNVQLFQEFHNNSWEKFDVTQNI